MQLQVIMVSPHLVVPHNILMCTWSPRSLQSLSRDLLNKMATSLAQNKTMVKLTLTSGVVHNLRDAKIILGQDAKLTQVQDAKLFIRHLLLGLSGNKDLTDLTLCLPLNCWDWPQGEINLLHTV